MFHCFCLSSLVFVCVKFRFFNGGWFSNISLFPWWIESLKTQFSLKMLMILSHLLSFSFRSIVFSMGNMKLELLIERCLLSAKLIKISESWFPLYSMLLNELICCSTTTFHILNMRSRVTFFQEIENLLNRKGILAGVKNATLIKNNQYKTMIHSHSCKSMSVSQLRNRHCNNVFFYKCNISTKCWCGSIQEKRR